MKVCSLYGAGYHYIPGTDICQKIGGYVRYENSYGYGENITGGPFTANAGLNTRTNGAADYVNRVRAYITEETRQQTAYGTLRTYLNVGVNFDSPATSNAGQSAGGFNANRAFIQIAGFTFGRATSYYDFYSAPATGYFAPPSSDNGDPGVTVAAYTAQLGNGLSTSLSFEDPASRRQVIANVTAANGGNGLYPTTTPRKVQFPDIIANLRIDQAWGSAQVMGAIHDASAGYYGATSNLGHPSDTTLGWAVGAGLKVNFPMFGPGDYLQAQFNYANGASRYVATSLGSQNAMSVNGSSFGYGVVSDAIYTNAAGLTGGSVNLTTSWGFNAAYEHFWTPSVRTSLYGSYFKTSYNAQANAALCAAQGAAFGLQATCNNNYGMWTIGSRTQWNVTKDFYVGLDTIYLKLNTASAGSGGLLAAGVGGATAPGVYTVSDQSAWAVRFRAHRDIVP